MTNLPQSPIEVVFTGLPGTLKTFLSARLAHRLNAVWLPTGAVGNLSFTGSVALDDQRETRYKRCVAVVRFLRGMRARFVVDGGFVNDAVKHELFGAHGNLVNGYRVPKVLVVCSADKATRVARLRARADDAHDAEQASAADIVLTQSEHTVDDLQGHSPPLLRDLPCDAILQVDTASFSVTVEGEIAESLRESLLASLRLALDEYRATDKCKKNDEIKQSFDALAPLYEETTDWRSNPTLLAHLQVQLPQQVGDVLDIGSGTGLAAGWYSAQGHRCVGVDLSPKMSVRAAPRLLFTNFGSALDLPYFDSSFDLVLMRQMLHYTEPTLAIQEAHRVMRPDGTLVLASVIAPSREVKPVWEEFKNVTQPLRLRVFDEDDLRALLSEVGFEPFECRRASLLRTETLAQLALRGLEPVTGWPTFIDFMHRIFTKIAPDMEFQVHGDTFSYRQSWLTLLARKRHG